MMNRFPYELSIHVQVLCVMNWLSDCKALLFILNHRQGNIPNIIKMNTFQILVNKVKPEGNLLLSFPLLTRILNVSTKGIKCTKNRNRCVNEGEQAHKSSNRREAVPLW